MVMVETSAISEEIKLEDREIVNPNTSIAAAPYIRRVGVSLTNEEAQEYIKRRFRVDGDEYGPFLLVRLPAYMRDLILVADIKHVDVTFVTQSWSTVDRSGVICWLKEVV